MPSIPQDALGPPEFTAIFNARVPLEELLHYPKAQLHKLIQNPLRCLGYKAHAVY